MTRGGFDWPSWLQWLNEYNWLDLLIVIVLLWSTIRSFRRGLSREVIGLAAMLLAFVLAMWFYGIAGTLIQPYVGTEQIAKLTGFFAIAILVLIAGAIVSWIVGRFLKVVGLSPVDRVLGAVFGLARGVLLFVGAFTAFLAYGPHAGTDNNPSSLVNSKLAPYILEASQMSVAVAPMDLKQNFRKYYSRVQTAVRGSSTPPEKSEQRKQN